MKFFCGSAVYYTAGIDQSNTRLRETRKIVNPIDINETDAFEKIKVYPNPVMNTS